MYFNYSNMKNRNIFTIAFLFLAAQALCQNYEKIILDQNQPRTGYYLAVKPAGPIDGVLVLLPGFGESPENVFPETKLHNTAYSNNILTVIIPFGDKIYADGPTISNINRALEDSIKRFGIAKNKFIIGGFSAGGTIALRYTELCNESPSSFPIEPKAVFTIDSPIDLFDLWRYFDREIERNFSPVGMAEARNIKAFLTKDLKGTPESNPEAYESSSPFHADLQRAGNERYLKDIPVRVYHDLDIVWQLKNRRRSLFDNNAECASELIARLMLMGNDRAEFMIAKTPGYRSNGMRHTHSWSIVDEVELIQWMKGVLKG